MKIPIDHVMLRFELISPATFGRGDGLPGLVDAEVEHDCWGFPFLRGRTLRGMLTEEMEAVLYLLGQQPAREWQRSRDRLLGVSARTMDETGILHVGDACLPERVRRLIAASIKPNKSEITKETVLEALTAIRRQTAMTHLGAPERASLRALRVILRGTRFEARLSFDETPQPRDLALLAAAVLAWRRAGTGRNRGRGHLRASLEDEKWTHEHFDFFRQEVTAQ